MSQVESNVVQSKDSSKCWMWISIPLVTFLFHFLENSSEISSGMMDIMKLGNFNLILFEVHSLDVFYEATAFDFKCQIELYQSTDKDYFFFMTLLVFTCLSCCILLHVLLVIMTMFLYPSCFYFLSLILF